MSNEPKPGFVPAFIKIDSAHFDGPTPITHFAVSNGPSLHLDLTNWHCEAPNALTEVAILRACVAKHEKTIVRLHAEIEKMRVEPFDGGLVALCEHMRTAFVEGRNVTVHPRTAGRVYLAMSCGQVNEDPAPPAAAPSCVSVTVPGTMVITSDQITADKFTFDCGGGKVCSKKDAAYALRAYVLARFDNELATCGDESLTETAHAPAAAPAPIQSAELPEDVRSALDRMCTPLDESHLKGATAEADARCMAIIKRHIEALATPAAAPAPASSAIPDNQAGTWLNDEQAVLLDTVACLLEVHEQQGLARRVHEIIRDRNFTKATKYPPTAQQEQAKPTDLQAAARDVLAERQRQVEQEGWTPEHDDKYNGCEMAAAAATYAVCVEPGQLGFCLPTGATMIRVGRTKSALVDATPAPSIDSAAG